MAKAKKKYNSPGGSGRGNKGVFTIDGERPGCPLCGETMTSSKDRWRCKPCRKSQTKVYKERGGEMINSQRAFESSWGFDRERAVAHAMKCEKGKRLIVTSVQNNSNVHKKGLAALKQACQFYKCELAVIPSHYLNRDTYRKDDEKSYDPKVQQYLTHGGIQFGNVKIKTDVKIRPTTLHPLSGKFAHGGEDWIIFGHPQLACEPVPTPTNMIPKKMYTTGFLSLPNYENSDIGEKASFQHSQAALILEKYKDVVFVLIGS